jgi:hypothetical protein
MQIALRGYDELRETVAHVLRWRNKEGYFT